MSRPFDRGAETIDPFASAPGDEPPVRTTGDAGADRYSTVRPLGKGGMGEVTLAEDRALGRRVACKALRPDLAHLPEARARFLREARVMAQLEHPGIVPLYDLGTDDAGGVFYTMRRVRGRTLRAALEDAGTSAARTALLAPFTAACHAVAFAHAHGVVHRDLKPENLMLGPFGEALVLDWGLAKVRDEGDEVLGSSFAIDGGSLLQTRAGQVVGTPSYMSPEQALARPVGPPSDVWSLGIVLREILTGSAPWGGEVGLARVREGDVPAELAAIAAKAVRPDPADRYPDAGALAADLDAWAAGALVGAHRYRPAEHLARWVRRHRAATLAGVVSVAIVTVAGTFAFVSTARDRDAAVRAEERAVRSLAEARRGTLTALAAVAEAETRPGDAAALLRAAADEAPALDAEVRRLGAEALPRVLASGATHVRSIARRGDRLAVAWLDGRVIVTSVTDGRVSFDDTVPGAPDGLAFADDGLRILVGTRRAAVVEGRDPVSGRVTSRRELPHRTATPWLSVDGARVGWFEDSRLLDPTGTRGEPTGVPGSLLALGPGGWAAAAVGPAKTGVAVRPDGALGAASGLDGVAGAAFSRDGAWVAWSGGSSQPWIAWTPVAGGPAVTAADAGESDGWRDLGFSPDAAVVTARTDAPDGGVVAAWDRVTGARLARVEAAPQWGHAASDRARWLAWTRPDGTLTVRDLGGVAPDRALRGHGGWVSHLEFHDDRLVTAGMDGRVLEWELSARPDDRRTPLPPGTRAFRTASGAVALWSEGRVGIEPGVWSGPFAGLPCDLARGPNGGAVAAFATRCAGRFDLPPRAVRPVAGLRAVDLGTGAVLLEAPEAPETATVAVGPGRIAWVTRDGCLALDSLPATPDARRGWCPGGAPPDFLSWSADGASLAGWSGEFGEDLVVWDAATRTERARIPLGGYAIGLSPSPAPGGPWVATGSAGVVLVGGDGAATPVLDRVPPSTHVAWSPDGRSFAFATPDGVAWVFTADGTPRWRRAVIHGQPAGVAFGADGRWLAVGDGEGTDLALVEADTGLPARRARSPEVAGLVGRFGGALVASLPGVDELVQLAEPPPDAPGASLAVGARVNLRVCPDDLSVVPVWPYPPADTRWAPAGSCP